MFYSTYIPTNIGREDCAVYSELKRFDSNHLNRAYNYLMSETPTEEGITVTNSCMTFEDDPSIHWTVQEIYLAHKALEVAVKNNFGFFIIKDENKIPQLFVSKAFKSCTDKSSEKNVTQRILVNALTNRSIILSDPNRITCVTCMIDHKYPYSFCQEMFTNLENLDKGVRSCLQLLIVNSGEEEEYVVTNPYTLPYGLAIQDWGKDVMQELRSIVNGETTETESFRLGTRGVERIDSIKWPILSMTFLQEFFRLYDEAKFRRSTYNAIVDENYDNLLYFSTNNRYLVHGKSLEVIVIKNQQLKRVLKAMVDNETNSKADINTVWRLANAVK